MKRIFLLSLLAAAASTAFAQSNVTLYGIVDGGVTRVSGVKGGTITQFASGIMEGSRWGLRGSEDLGGGYRAVFTAESRFEVDTGSVTNRPITGSQLPDRVSNAALMGLPGALQPVINQVSAGIGSTVGTNLAGALFDRQVFVGLVTPVGAVLGGRQYTPAYELSGTFDTLNTQSSLSAGQAAAIPSSIDIRVSNALAYRIQQGPFTASAMYALGEGSTTTGRLAGGMGMYKSDAFAVGAGYNTRKNERGEKSLTSTVVGASVNVGPGTISTLYVVIKDDHPTGLSGIAAQVTPAVGAATAALVQGAYINGFTQDARLFHVGYRFTTGLHTVWVAYNALNDKRPNNADTTSYGVAYSYSLSKRTDLNAVVTRFDNKGLGQAAPGNAGYLGGVTTSAGTDSTSVSLGIRHRF